MIIEVFLLLEVFVMTFFCLGFFFQKRIPMGIKYHSKLNSTIFNE